MFYSLKTNRVLINSQPIKKIHNIDHVKKSKRNITLKSTYGEDEENFIYRNKDRETNISFLKSCYDY